MQLEESHHPGSAARNLTHRISTSRYAYGVLVGLALGTLVLVAGAAAQNAKETGAKGTDKKVDDSQIVPLDFKCGKLHTVTIYPGDETGARLSDQDQVGRVYWYLPYTLTYKGKTKDRFFVTISAHSDKGKKYSDLPLAYVAKKIERIEKQKLISKSDLLKEGKAIDAYEEFSPGETRKCVAIFNPLDPEADKIVIDVHGLVNDLRMENSGPGRLTVYEKVLRLTFLRPGDEFYTSLDRFTFEGKTWVEMKQEIETAQK